MNTVQKRLLSLGLAGGLALAGTAAPAAVATADEPVTLTWASIWFDIPQIVGAKNKVNWWDLIIQKFEETHPNIKVTALHQDYGKISVEEVAGDAPDVINSCCTGLYDMGRNGLLLDLTPYFGTVIPDYRQSGSFYPPQFSAWTIRGHQYALPQYLGTIAMWANKEIFANAGVAVPTDDLSKSTLTWDGFEALCKKLTQKGADGRTVQWGFQPAYGGDRMGYWLVAAGAEFYQNDDRSVSALDSPAADEALSFLQRLRYQDQCAPPAGVSGGWAQGHQAMKADGSWRLNREVLGLNANGSKKTPFAINFFPMPMGPARRATLATIDGNAVSASTKHPKEAVEFLDFTTSAYANQVRAEYLGLQPARHEVVPQYLSLMQSRNPEAYQLNLHVFTDAGPFAYPQYLYTDEQAAEGILGNAYSQIFNKQAPVKGTWSSAIKSLNAILASEQQNGGKSAPHPAQTLHWAGADWTSQDINMLAMGGATPQGNAITLHVGGADIWGSSDQFHYVYQQVSGDFTAVVQLTQTPDTSTWSKSGIMVRQSTDPSSAQLLVCGSGGNGIRIQYRAKAKDASHDMPGPKWSNGTPVWLKLVRQGTSVTGYSSTDKQTWTKIGTQQIALKDPVLVGLASTSHTYAVLSDATFNSWSLTKG